MHNVIAKGVLVIVVGIGLDTGRTVCGSSPGAADTFRAVHTGTEVHPASIIIGTGSISRCKRPVLGADHLLLLSDCEWVGAIPSLPLVPAEACHYWTLYNS
jgi:hypothetical protein